MVQVRRDPRKVKSSFSLRAPCVTSSRIDDGVPVAWQRSIRRKKRTWESRSTNSLSLHSFLLTVSAPFPPYEWLYSLAPLDSSPSGGRHLNWTVAIVGVSLLRGSERGRESEKASSFGVPFCFGAASFKSYRRRGNYSPKSVEIVRKRSQPQLYRWTHMSCNKHREAQ